MQHTGIGGAAVTASSASSPTSGSGDHPAIAPDANPWQDTIAAADQALEEAARIQRGVQHNLKLLQEVRALREELRKAHAEIDRYRGMHARVVMGMRQLEEENTSAMSRLHADSEMLRVRHRVYRLLAEHYARVALRLDPQAFAGDRDRVLQHILFQRRKGVLPEEIGLSDLAFLLL
ncbi:conserved hypothetical protein [Cupriavidus taiwanensis]|uniref:Uncharacterized protein n=1 Tax=Cupriavidus taiwanensis TaxID=164546 RepID=A0A375BMA6_9BURK|nr:hypothetical protein [Cupriavidus taiwanensis]SOY47823.1 conserved hypothetical protein [Cupriavidus taiwanensis]